MAHPHGCAIYLYGWHIRNGRSPCKDRQQLTADMPQGGRSFSRLKTLVLHGLSPCVAKGRLSHCKRWPFSVQKTAFWKAKDRLLRKKQTNAVDMDCCMPQCRMASVCKLLVNKALTGCFGRLPNLSSPLFMSCVCIICGMLASWREFCLGQYETDACGRHGHLLILGAPFLS